MHTDFEKLEGTLVRISISQSRSFVSIGLPLWNRLPLESAAKSSLVSCPRFSLTSKPVFSLGVKCTGSVSESLMLREALYKWTNTIQNHNSDNNNFETIYMAPYHG